MASVDKLTRLPSILQVNSPDWLPPPSLSRRTDGIQVQPADFIVTAG